MALDQGRAERIRQLKHDRPDLTWAAIADKVGVKERSAIDWQKTGGIEYENCKKLAKVFGVDPQWLWSGAELEGTPDLLGTLSPTDRSQLDRIEAKLDLLLEQVGGIDPADFTEVITRGFVAPDTADEAARAASGTAPLSDAKPATPRARSPRKRRSA